MTAGRRLSASELAEGVAQYGRTLVFPPAATFDTLDFIKFFDAQGAAYGVRVPLWTREEGRSDLEIELTLREVSEGLIIAAIDNLHVP
jgi:hypothetical protein